MTIEEEVRAFAEVYIPDGARYIRSGYVPVFKGTWEDVFAGRVAVDEQTQRKVLKRLRDIFGNRDKWARMGMP